MLTRLRLRYPHPHPHPRFLSTAGPSLAEAAASNAEHVALRDRDGYLCSLLLPPAARPHVHAVRALNIELASAADLARGNAMGARMRLQWWREQVEGAYGGRGAAAHPIAVGLRAAVAECALSRVWLDRMVDAREADLDGAEPPPSLEALVDYSDRTAGSLLRLSVECAGGDADAADEACAAGGVGLGLAVLLRGTPHHVATEGRLRLPRDALEVRGVAVGKVVGGDPDAAASPELAEAAADVAHVARQFVARARAAAPGGAAGAALLPLVPADRWLRRLAAADHRLFADALAHGGERPLWTQLELLKARWLGL